MPLHSLRHVTIGVPDVESVAAYYSDFGLTRRGDAFATTDGGEQLRLVATPHRQLVAMTVGVDDQDDIDRIAHQVDAIGVPAMAGPGKVTAVEPIAGFTVTATVMPRLDQQRTEPTAYNSPGRAERIDQRAPGVLRAGAVRPRKLGHAVIGSVDHLATRAFFTDGLGFKVTDYIKGHGAFMRCSTDHHNVLVLDAPVNFLHHTSWQVNDIDEVGRGATAMLEDHPDRHVWGLGRHHAGSNFFWYLKDPAGNFSEYYSDMDCVVDDQLWKPEDLEGAKGLFSWGPPPPRSFLAPDDLAALMTGTHTP